jgi:hypothetical protein
MVLGVPHASPSCGGAKTKPRGAVHAGVILDRCSRALCVGLTQWPMFFCLWFLFGATVRSAGPCRKECNQSDGGLLAHVGHRLGAKVGPVQPGEHLPGRLIG